MTLPLRMLTKALVARFTLILVVALAIAGPGLAAPRGETIKGGNKPSAEATQNTEAQKYYQFGNQYFQQGMLRQAEEALRKALAVQPTYPDASYLLGLVLIEVNDYRGAIAEAEKALAENPFLTEAHNLMGLALARMGNFDAALKEFEAVKADVSFPTPEVAHFNIGKVFWEKQACGEALVHFRRALEINPQFWRAWYLLGDCQEQLGQIDLSRASYEKALAIEPHEIAPQYRLGYVCFQGRDFACARKYFTSVRDLAPTTDMAAGAREYLRQMEFR